MSLTQSHAHAASSRPILIVFSHLRWDFVYQRPQHLLTRAAADYEVYFIEEPLFESMAGGFRETPQTGGPIVIQPLLPPGTTPADTLRHQRMIARTIAERAGSRPLYLWYYTPMALAFSGDIGADLIVFDKMDELSAFDFAPPELLAAEAELMRVADIVFTGGASLHAAAAGRHPQVHCFPSSIDARHFGQARFADLIDPDDQFEIARPRVGFFGVIDERIDQTLIAEVAALRPDWQLVMVGPTAKVDPAKLPQAANIHWLGKRAYADLPAFMAHWDLGWMPFARNAATQFISPTKTPEFLAAGLPLMSTSIRDVVEPYGRLGMVAIADTAAAMVAAGDRLLAAGEHAEHRRATDAFLAGGSWDATWAAMRALVDTALAAPATIVPAERRKEVAHV